MWYILETEGNVAGSVQLGAVQILGVGTSLQHAQSVAVAGLLDAADGMQLAVPNDAVDFAYLVQFTAAAGRTVVAVQVSNGWLVPHNR